jgi:hypothetical protein
MTTRAESGSHACALMLAVLGGAAFGAVAMALTTPRTGREVRNTLRSALRFQRPDSVDDSAWDPEDLEAMFI